MPIEVKCNQCGKGLKAPDTIAGKKAKCPACGTVLVVPTLEEEIFDAELVEPSVSAAMESGRFGGMGNLLDDELAYRVAEPDRTPVTSSDERRPCPACGEMIPVAAAKCRFCNEIFDAGLRRKQRTGRSGRGAANAELASRLSRLGAAMLDGIIGMVFMLPGFLLIVTQVDSRTKGPNPVAIIGTLLLAAGGISLLIVQLALLTNRGQTMGKRLAGVRIVDHFDGSNPGFVKAVLLRSVVPGFIGGIPLIGPLFGLVDILCIFGDERRCIHDQMAGTIVVQAQFR